MRSPKRSTLMSVLVFLCVCGAAASAHAQATGLGPFDPKTGRYGSAVTAGPARAPDTLNATPAKVWSALIQVYSQMGVPLSIADTEKLVIGALRVAQRKPVGGQRLSSLLECGSSVYGSNADQYAVKLTWLSHVQAINDKQSAVDVRVGGSAAPNGLNSTVNCASTGKLEEMTTQELRKALGG